MTENVAPGLAYVALVVSEPMRLAETFLTDFGLPFEALTMGEGSLPEVPFVSVGESALALFEEGDPRLGPDARRGVDHIAIVADDPPTHARALGIDAEATDGGVGGRRQVILPREATAGVRVRLTDPLDLGNGRSPFVERIDHLGVASENNQAARDVFIGALGCVYESEQTDSEVETRAENFTSNKYRYVFHTHPPRLVGSMRVTFISVGDCELEFLQDLTAQLDVDEGRHDQAGNTRGDRSAIARYVASRGAGLHHLALKTPNIDDTLAHLAASGHRMIDLTGRPGSRRARIGFMHPSALGGVLLHLVERSEVSP